ncbi:hypothetical protein BP5796_05697 [Coleophoma crateriformis]|uniref:alpha-galactosidase n=1 Tax=Coleophoma crateriformis TaxID=565419 RepID=A0A3D8RV13_9HELO|nr:hypothetical protein BP5796_05697 [Coleophoma crateriformis]
MQLVNGVKGGVKRFRWNKEGVQIDFVIDEKKQIWIYDIGPSTAQTTNDPSDLPPNLDQALPLTQIRLAGEGSVLGTSHRVVYSALSHRLLYESHRERKESPDLHVLEITTKDPLTGLEVLSQFSIYTGIPVLRCTAIVTNKGTAGVYLQTFSSLSIGGLNRKQPEWWKDYRMVIPHSNLFREAQWRRFTLPELGMDYCGESDFNLPGTRASVILSNQGTFSTEGHLPMGALEKADGSECWMWQIEHSGAWRWEFGNILESLYIVAGGPTDNEQWTKYLAPDESFTSVPVGLAVVAGNCEDAFAPMTQYRRRIRRKHADNDNLPVIFNDYMNCLMGDPTEEKVEKLIEPARQVGSEYFVIDAGWYAEDPDWWETVGAWEPSKIRFPNGLKTLLDKIRAAGMVPGLWLEPEVIGVKSPLLGQFPNEAYFQRYGVRVSEQGRHQLDFRHPVVRSRLDAVVDRLVLEYGVGYFKLDYNIDVTQGTDIDAASPGDGMLEHRRAYMSWVNGLYDRFPDLVLESCCSGAQRLDYHMLATHSIQSTSDQQDSILYAAISAAVPTALTPEQSASWAYPQPDWSDDLIGFTMVNSLLGRAYLSGRVDLMSASQLELIKDGLTVYKQIRQDIKNSVPFWPNGLHEWHQEWLSLGLRSNNQRYLGIWRRGGDESCCFPIKDLVGKDVKVECLYPKKAAGSLSWDKTKGVLSVSLKDTPCARLLRLS